MLPTMLFAKPLINLCLRGKRLHTKKRHTQDIEEPLISENTDQEETNILQLFLTSFIQSTAFVLGSQLLHCAHLNGTLFQAQ